MPQSTLVDNHQSRLNQEVLALIFFERVDTA